MSDETIICICDCVIMTKTKPLQIPKADEQSTFVKHVYEKQPDVIAIFLHADKEEIIVHCKEDDKLLILPNVDKNSFIEILNVLTNLGYKILYKFKKEESCKNTTL